MKLQYINFIPQKSYTYGHTTVTPYIEVKPKNKNKFILEENDNHTNMMSKRNSMISRIYPLSNCSSCRK